MLRVVLILAILADGLGLPMAGSAAALPAAPPSAGLPEALDPHAGHHAPAALQLDGTGGEQLPADPACQDAGACASLCAHAAGALPAARLTAPAMRPRSRLPAKGRLLYESHHSDLLTRPPIGA